MGAACDCQHGNRGAELVSEHACNTNRDGYTSLVGEISVETPI